MTSAITGNGLAQGQKLPVWRRLVVPFAFVALSLLIMLPEILLGLSTSNSLLYNVVWGEQVSALMREGTFYPRWLPDGWNGLGSPAFYFYSPLFFLSAGAVSCLFGGMVESGVAVSLTSALFLATSALAMRSWLSRWTEGNWATLGAFLYLLAPYRLHDIYNRGSLAEATTYLAFPLLLTGLARIKARERHGVVWTALAYLLLVTGHLPVALLATVSLVPAYVLWEARSGRAIDQAFVLKSLVAGLLGLGLSAAFLLPALGLLPHVSAEELSSPYYSPESWFLFSGPNSIFAGQVLDIVLQSFALATGYLLICIAAWFAAPTKKGATLWAVLAVVCFVMVSGLLPFLWQLPGLHQVQFPSRFLSIMEFVTITALACTAGRLWRPGLVVALLLLVPATVSIIDLAAQRMVQVAETKQDKQLGHLQAMRDAPEYLPAGYPVGVDGYGRADPDRTVLPDVPEVSAVKGQVTAVSASKRADGGLSVSVDAVSPATIRVRRFVFPHWHLVPAAGGRDVPIRADGQKLVSWDVPAGRHEYDLVAGQAPYERAGYLISGLSALILVFLLFVALWQRKGGG